MATPAGVVLHLSLAAVAVVGAVYPVAGQEVFRYAGSGAPAFVLTHHENLRQIAFDQIAVGVGVGSLMIMGR